MLVEVDPHAGRAAATKVGVGARKLVVRRVLAAGHLGRDLLRVRARVRIRVRVRVRAGVTVTVTVTVTVRVRVRVRGRGRV